MKRLLGLGTAAAVIFAVAGVANAKPLNWEGTLTSVLGTLPESVVTGGGVAELNGSSGTLPAHLMTVQLPFSRQRMVGTDVNIITDPETVGNGIAAVIYQYQMENTQYETIGNISGAVPTTAAGGVNPNVLPIAGIAKICLLSTICDDFLPMVLTQPTTNGARYQLSTYTNATAQLTTLGLQGKRLGVAGTGVKGVGIGGLITVGGGTGSPIRISLEAAPWTVKTATVTDQTDDGLFTNVTRRGFAHGPASATTSTAQPSGLLQIVSPAQVRTNLALGSNVKIGVITTMIIHFIPEPGLLLLIGSGVVGLAVLGRNRMRR